MTTAIPGYALGSPALPRSPIGPDDLALLEATVLMGDDDLAALRASRAVLEPQADAILDTWYGFVGANPHLLAAFLGPDGQPVGAYLQAVRRRFERWILDTADARYDQAWLDYQDEIGRRHHRVGKNRADGVEATDHIPFRYLVALLVPIVLTLEPFLAAGGDPPEEVKRMHQAWLKSVTLQVILWSRPYVAGPDF